jgi:CRISPR system Cascade subunit CasE
MNKEKQYNNINLKRDCENFNTSKIYLTCIYFSSKRWDILLEKHKLHGIVFRFFNTKEEHKLFRYNLKEDLLYILSENQPKILEIINRLKVNRTDIEIKQYTIEEYTNIEEHKNYKFNILVNPTHRNSKTRKVLSINWKDWIYRKSRENGFEIQKIKNMKGMTYLGKNNTPIYGVEIDGVLSVSDVEKFSECMINGIGRSKGYGFGFLILDRE